MIPLEMTTTAYELHGYEITEVEGVFCASAEKAIPAGRTAGGASSQKTGSEYTVIFNEVMREALYNLRNLSTSANAVIGITFRINQIDEAHSSQEGCGRIVCSAAGTFVHARKAEAIRQLYGSASTGNYDKKTQTDLDGDKKQSTPFEGLGDLLIAFSEMNGADEMLDYLKDHQIGVDPETLKTIYSVLRERAAVERFYGRNAKSTIKKLKEALAVTD